MSRPHTTGLEEGTVTRTCRSLVLRRGLSGLSDQGRMVAISGGSRPNQFCKCSIVGLYILYIVMCDINMTTFKTSCSLSPPTLIGLGPVHFSINSAYQTGTILTHCEYIP